MTEQSKRVLIVCEDAERLESIARSLDGGASYSLDQAEGVSQALELLARPNLVIDFIIIDTNLAYDSNVEPIRSLVEEAAARCPEANIILLAGMAQDWPDGLRLTVCSTLAELSAHIRRVLEGQGSRGSTPADAALDVLLETNRALHDPRSAAEVLTNILESLRAVGFERARLYVMSDDGLRMSVAAHVGMPEGFGETSYACPESLRTFFTMPDPKRAVAGAAGPLSFERFLVAEGTREWVCAPLLQKDQLIGVLSADTGVSGRSITEEMTRHLPLFAALLRTALWQNIIAEVGKQFQTFKDVLLLYKSINSTLEFDNILNAACDCALQLMRVEQCWLMLFEDDCEKGIIRACTPKGLLVPGSEIHLEDSSIKKTIVVSKSCLLVSFNKDGDDGLEAGDELGELGGPLRESGVHTSLLVPVVSQGRVLGALGLDSIGHERMFNEAEISLCHVFAGQVALAMENANLYSETKRQARQLVKQHNELESVIASMPSGIIAVDTEGRVKWANPRAWQILGYDSEKQMPKEVSRIYYDPDESCIIDKKLSADGVRGIEYMTFVRAKDGSAIPIRLYVTALMGANNRREGSVGSFQDLRCDQQTTLLLEACGKVAQADTVRNGLQPLAEMLLKLFPATFCRILLLEEGGLYLTIDAAEAVLRGLAPLDWNHRRGQHLPVDSYPGLRQILEQKRPKVLRYRNSRSRPELDKYSQWLGLKAPVQSLLLVPLRVGEKTVGLLSLGELRKEERSPSTRDRIELAAKIAEQVAALIDRRRLQEADDRRNQLLEAVTERAHYIRGDKEREKLLQEFVRLSLEIVGYTASGLYVYRSKQDSLELGVTYPAATGLTPQYMEQVEAFAERVAREREAIAIDDHSDVGSRSALLRPGVKGALFVPLKLSTGEVEAVLFAVKEKEKPRFAELELEALRHFAELASGALQTASLMKERMVKHLELLQQLSGYAQVKQDVGLARDALLTCITAGYGLCFNRAVIIERDGKMFRGVCGIGHVKAKDAQDDWDADRVKKLDDFASYVKARDEGTTFSTPIGERIGDFHCADNEHGGGIFSRAGRVPKPLLLKVDELHQLPADFLELFQPETDVVLIPLAARGQVKGFIVADNKFTQGPITKDDIESLLTFANTIAIAIDNIELFAQLNKAQEAARVVAKVTALGESQESLLSVVNGTKEALGCDAVTLYTYDDEREDFDYPPKMAGVRDEDAVIKLGKVTEESVVRDVLNRGDLYLDSLYVAKDTPNDGLLGKAFAKREGIASSVAARLTERGRPVGVMFVNFHEPHEFTEHELSSIDLFARQAAVAIRNKQLYEQQKMRAARLQILHEAGRDITSSLDLNEILRRIARQASRLASYKEKDANFVDIKLIYEKKVWLAAAHPEEEVAHIHERLGEVIDLNVGIGDRIGIIGRVIRDGENEFVNNVLEDEDYYALNEGTRSQIVVRIENGGQVIGVISAEHEELNAFDKETLMAMESLAAQAGIAIVNARRFEALDKAQTQIDAQTSLALMGMASNIWQHDIVGWATDIINELDWINRETPEEVLRPQRGRLDMIRVKARMIHQHPDVIHISPKTAEPLLINDWVGERLKVLRGYDHYKPVEFNATFDDEKRLFVRIHKEWLRPVFDIPVHNAVKAMESSEVKSLMITVGARDGWVEISFADTGCGIPEGEIPHLTQKPIVKSLNGKGLGVGLLMAQTILKAYGGDISIGPTSSQGTTVVIRLPAESHCGSVGY